MVKKTSFSAKELASRWKMNPTSLANWRAAGKGPAFIRDGYYIRYPLHEVEKWDKILSAKKDLQLPDS